MSIFGMPTSSSISMFTPCPLWHAHNTQLPMVHSACTHFVSKTIIACALHENAQHSLFKVQKTLEGFLEHYSGEFIDISCISSLLASIKSSRACIMEFPSSGSHLHLVIVSDKSSRGEVADLIARILTRWRVDRDHDQGSQVGGNGSHLETRVEVAEKKGVACHSIFTCQHWADY